jgi:hypothetical protein
MSVSCTPAAHIDIWESAARSGVVGAAGCSGLRAPCPFRARSGGELRRLTVAHGLSGRPQTSVNTAKTRVDRSLLSSRSGVICLSGESRPCKALIVPTTGASGAPEVQTELVGVRGGSRGDRTRGARPASWVDPTRPGITILTIKRHRRQQQTAATA